MIARSTKIVVTLLILISCTLIVSADQTNDSDKYTFQNYGGEEFTPQPMEFGANTRTQEQNGVMTASSTLENGTERKHVFLQFYSNPNQEQQEILDIYDILLLRGVGVYTFIASIPSEYTAADLPSDVGLRWMGEIPVENKYDSYGLNVPEWARTESGEVKLAMYFYEDVTSQDSISILEKYSYNFSAPSSSRPWYYETISNESNITLIASEDAVQSVGYYGAEDEPAYDSDFVDYEVVIEEDIDDSGFEDVQEDDFVDDLENSSDTDGKKSPGFTSTTGILIFALISVLCKSK